MTLHIEKFDHEVKRVHVLLTQSGGAVLVCVDCALEEEPTEPRSTSWIHTVVAALPDGRYLHVGEQADVGQAPTQVYPEGSRAGGSDTESKLADAVSDIRYYPES